VNREIHDTKESGLNWTEEGGGLVGLVSGGSIVELRS